MRNVIRREQGWGVRVMLWLLLGLLMPAGAGDRAAAQALPEVCRNPYTQQQEVELGDKVVAEVYKQMPVLPDSNPVSQYVRQLGAKLANVAPVTPGLERQWPFTFHVVASSEINAFALPGGTMFVDLGAIQAAQTEAQLAGVMAHEMSHVILRHSTCNMVKQQKRGILFGLGQIAASMALGGGLGNLAAQGIGLGQNLTFLRMSRDDEKQADLLGVHLMHDAGFDPRGLPQFFEIILAKSGQRSAQWLSDHPNPGNRSEYLQREIATMPPLDHPTVTSAAFKAAHARAADEHALTAAEMKAGSWKTSGLYAAAPGGSASQGAPVPAQPAGYAPPTGSGAAHLAGAVVRLSGAQLGLSVALKRVQGAMFSISAPENWTRADSAQGFTLAPPGGSGAGGVAYGAVLGVVRQEGQGVGDATALRQASDAYASQLVQASQLTAEGDVTSLQVAGQAATSRTLRGASPLSGGVSERDWLVTVARTDGDLDTLIFVAPADQFNSLQPLFQRMLASFHPQ